ncbi:MAG: MSMEG_0569 family flavin-dependent oxidoreductase [Verrucomicrobiota bacterium]
MSVIEKDVDVIVIGAGQAGLSVSYYLQKQGITSQAIFEKNEVAHSWKKERWDSFCLVTPNFQCRLPDHPYAGPDPEGFMLKDEIVDYVAGFANKVTSPIYEGVEVLSVHKESDRFVVETSTEGIWRCKQVVVATGSFHTPVLPPNVESIPDSITQLIATDYRNPGQIPEGAVAVVGSGQSGCQIAEDLMLDGRQVHLFLGNAPRSPRQYRGKDAVAWLEEMGYYKTTFAEHPDKQKALTGTNHYLTGRDGGREIDLRKFVQRGLKLYGYLDQVSGEGFNARADVKEKLDAADRSYLGIRKRIDEYIEAAGIDAPEEPEYAPCWEPELDLTELNFKEQNISSIIWCIGFRPNFGYLKLDIFNSRGFPIHNRGITEAPGLFFIGLPWQHTWGSSRFSGIAEDSKFIADKIEKAMKTVSETEYFFV